MKKLLFILSCLSLIPHLSAQTGKSATNGKVVAAKVDGNVYSVDPKTKESRPLKSNDLVDVKDTVKTEESSEATLVFSNGASVNLAQNSTLVISEFLQDPFSTMSETEEPSVSTMKLDLKKGEIVCKVKKLKVDQGSSLAINTPTGAAGVRGTTFQVTNKDNGDGTFTYTLSVTEGSVTFTDKDGVETVVPAGQQIEFGYQYENGKVVTGPRQTTQLTDGEIDSINSKGPSTGDTVQFEALNNPLDIPGVDPLGNPLDSFNEGGTAGGTTGGGGGIGGGGLGSLLGRMPAGGIPGGFIGATPGGGGDTPGTSGTGGGVGGGLVNPPVITKP